VPTEEVTYYDQIVQSLDELRSVCNKLKHENGALRSKIEDLESQLAQKSISKTESSLEGITDNDRIALRNQLSTYIKRIDQILETS